VIVDKTKLGISFFDESFGGVYRGRQVLCCGRNGSGKSILTYHFLSRAIQDGDKALLLSPFRARDTIILAESIGLPFASAVTSGQLTILEYASFIPESNTSSNVMLPPQAFTEIQEMVETRSIRCLVFDTVLPWVAIHPTTRIAEHIYSFIHALERLGVTSLLTLPKPASEPANILKSRLEDLCPVVINLDHDRGEHRTLRVTKYLGEVRNLATPFPFCILPDKGIVSEPVLSQTQTTAQSVVPPPPAAVPAPAATAATPVPSRPRRPINFSSVIRFQEQKPAGQMYTAYWNLRESPFMNVVNDRLIFMTDQHQEGIARLYYLIDQERVAGMLTGAYGVGKTMTLEYLHRHATKAKLPVIQIDAIPNGCIPMVRHILRTLNIPDKVETLPEALMALQTYCQANAHSLTRSLLLIDEAHHLAAGDGFYLAHFLCNLRIPANGNHEERPLFTIILAGTDDLRTLLVNHESLRRRIQLDCRLTALSPQQTTEYIQHHMRAVGGDIWSFSKDALDAVYTYTKGIPRSINNLCDTALMLGFVSQVPSVTQEIIIQAAKDTGLEAFLNTDTSTDAPLAP